MTEAGERPRGPGARAVIGGALNPATILTLTGLSFGVVAVAAALWGEVELGLVALIAAGLCDLFDGRVARSLDLHDEARAFGVQIDSLADMIAFGAAPAALVLAANDGGWQWLALAAALPYASCAGLRLAAFNLRADPGGDPDVYYAGLPVTYAALVLPLVYLAGRAACAGAAGALLVVALAALAALFVSDVPIRKPAGRAYAILAGLAAVVAAGLVVARAAACGL